MKTRRRELWDRRWSELDSDYSTWGAHHRELSAFFLPRRGRFATTDRNKGDKRNHSIHDNAGTRAAQILGAGLMAGATSPARPWFKVVTDDPELNNRFGVRRWLDDVTRLILRVCAKSNLYRVLHSTYEEIAVFGTGAFFVMPDPETVIHCHPLTAGEYRLACNFKGEVDTCYRTFSMTVGAVVKEFGLDVCSESVKNAHRDGFLSQSVTIRHVIEPREDRDIRAADNRNMPWKSVYYETGQDDDLVLRESGFEEFPVLAPRWETAGHDTYGHGPGMVALGDVKQLQQEQVRKSQAIDFQTAPPMLGPAEMKGQETKWAPGGITHVASTASQAGIRPAFETRLDLNALLMDIEDVRKRINSAFFADLFLMLTFQNDTTRKTATEIAERHEEKLIQLGPVLERLHTELLGPVVRRIYRELERAGVLPPAPPELTNIDLTLEFVSMLAQAQRAIGVAGIERVLLVAGSVAEAKPDILDNLDEDGLWSELTEAIGVPSRITHSPEVRDKLRRGKLASQQAAAQAALQEQQSKTAKNLATSPTDTPNALRDVTSMFSGYTNPSPQSYG